MEIDPFIDSDANINKKIALQVIHKFPYTVFTITLEITLVWQFVACTTQ